MRLTSRLLIGAVAIVVLSLVLSGGLTWLVIRGLEVEDAQAALVGDMAYFHNRVSHIECRDPNTALTSSGACPTAKLIKGEAGGADKAVYVAALAIEVRQLDPADRVLLLDGTEVVVWDSKRQALDGTQLQIGQQNVGRSNDLRTNFVINGATYTGVAATVPAWDPLAAHWLVISRDETAVIAAGASRLLLQLIGAGLVALVGSVALALILSRTITRPLIELAGASEDIARGNYSRRVKLSGGPEVGIVGQAFNRMGEGIERSRRLQRDFLANVSHELKTPLTSLIGFSQALLDGSLHTEMEQHRAATIINEEAHRVLRLAQELLDLARVESGQVSMHMQPVDLGVMLEQEVEFVRPRTEARQLTIDLKPSAALPPVRADPERLHQVLDNLLDNAVKYASPGTAIEVRVEIKSTKVEVSVINSVTGRTPDPMRMFDRFYRAEPSRSTAAGGVGLGLAISRELAEAQRGKLWADVDGDGRLHVYLALEPVGGAVR
ncbi:MAG TPA: HAMP domain-containing sensor histidine kinase [Candidatus Dormibacteraeota bacterium]|jgi:signal transduction histidine kinase|nr:HAMP domain-containing sensor histidine kinase [Candidatus Dormibacteraeota bacterium]